MIMKSELSPTEKLVMRLEMVEGSVREIRGRQLRLEDDWKAFVPAVSNRISKEIIIPAIVEGLIHAIRLPVSLEKEDEDPLSLRRILKKGGGLTLAAHIVCAS
jgi:hypothetical protein